MKIIIDADGCPVVDLTIEIAKKYNIEVKVICDTSHYINRDGAETIVISQGNDAVDFYIVNNIQNKDIVITQDYGLAAMVLSKNGVPINQNGYIYSNKNIDELLLKRHLSKKARNAGHRLKGPRKRTNEDDEKFYNTLIRLLEDII